MPGDRERIVQLNAGHGGVCKFGPSPVDQDNFKLVRSSIKGLYKAALEYGELSAIPPVISTGVSVDEDRLQARLASLRGKNT